MQGCYFLPLFPPLPIGHLTSSIQVALVVLVVVELVDEELVEVVEVDVEEDDVLRGPFVPQRPNLKD